MNKKKAITIGIFIIFIGILIYALTSFVNTGKVVDTLPVRLDTFEDNDIIWFITSEEFAITSYNENQIEMGGLTGADEKCNEAGKKFRRKFKALISTETINAKDRIPSSGRVVNTLGQVLIEDINNLFPITNLHSVKDKASIDENGNQNPDTIARQNVWWGSDLDGIKNPKGTCENWFGESGETTDTPIGTQFSLKYWDRILPTSCGIKPLICIAQTGPTPGECGDEITQTPYEECDVGAQNGIECTPAQIGGCEFCNDDCQKEHKYVCGNQRLEPGEECEDGNNIDDDGCKDCKFNPNQAGTLPDLYIKEIEVRKRNGWIAIVGHIENVGNKNPDFFETDFALAGNVVINKDIPSLSRTIFGHSSDISQGSAIYFFSIPSDTPSDNFKQGENTLTVHIDTANKIEEKYEHNNIQTIIYNHKL